MRYMFEHPNVAKGLPSMKSNLYTQILLTVIAGLLAWNAFLRPPTTTAYAQNPARYRTAWIGVGKEAGIDALNKAAEGGELVQVVAGGYNTYPGGNSSLTHFYAIFRDR